MMDNNVIISNDKASKLLAEINAVMPEVHMPIIEVTQVDEEVMTYAEK